MSVGFGVGMVYTDMILWLADGDKSEVFDLWSLDYTRPVIDDADNNVNTIEDGEDSTKVFTTRRALDTGDAQDCVIPLDQELIWNYALRRPDEELYKPENGLYRKHSEAAQFAITFRSTGIESR